MLMHLLLKLGATYGFTYSPGPEEKVNVEREARLMPAISSRDDESANGSLHGPHIHFNRVHVDASPFYQQPAVCVVLSSSPADQLCSLSTRVPCYLFNIAASWNSGSGSDTTGHDGTCGEEITSKEAR